MSAHAKLSPSTSNIWMNCAGMPRLCAGLEDTSSEAAEEGSAAHELAEQCLISEVDPMQRVGETINGFEVTKEMATAVSVYTDYIWLSAEDEDQCRVEETLKLNDDIWGTADFTRYRPSDGQMLVVDYKHGKGAFVGVEGNTQAIIYALMAVKSIGHQGLGEIPLVIVQPRCGSQAVRQWTMDCVELVEWEVKVMDAYAATLDPDAKLTSGSHCTWCLAAKHGVCPEINASAQAAAKVEFSHADTAVQWGERLKLIPALKLFIDTTLKKSYAAAISGSVVPGNKLVAKRGKAAWNDSIEDVPASIMALVEGYSREVLSKSKPLTVLQVQELVGEESFHKLSSLWEKKSSGWTLVSSDDKRDEVSPPNAASDFELIDQ